MLGGTGNLSQTLGGTSAGVVYTSYTIESELNFNQFKDLIERMFNIKKANRRSTRASRMSMTAGNSMAKSTVLPGTVEEIS